LQWYTVAAPEALPAGKSKVRFDFVYDGGGIGKGGTGTLSVDGKKVASGRIERTQCCAFSADEGADVGADEGTAVTDAYQVPFNFTGKIDNVTIELQETTKAAANESAEGIATATLKKAVSD
jgi:arylsulfatase